MWRRLRGDEGMTLTELLVAMATLSLVLVALVSFLGRVQVGLAHDGERGQADHKGRVALEQLDREIRSGSVLVDPSAESDGAHDISAGMSVRVYTQAYAGTPRGARCVQWRITSGQELQRRDWSVMGGRVSNWRVLAEHVVNRTLSPEVPAFSLAASGAATPSVPRNRAVNIDLVLSGDGSSGGIVRIHESVTGRNAQFGNPNNACSTIPPY